MDLLCLLPHLFGRAISVNGRHYDIGSKGHLSVSSKHDCASLLENMSGFCLDPNAVKPPTLMPLGDDGLPEYLGIAPEEKDVAEAQAENLGRQLPGDAAGLDARGQTVSADEIAQAAARLRTAAASGGAAAAAPADTAESALNVPYAASPASIKRPHNKRAR